MIVKPVGIENVVNWQDDGVFADTQKPVTDDNYTLAGDVNQDNLYVGYMKEHGLKGKLSLPVLSSLGAITGRQTIGDCEVYKHVNGTTIIKGAVINPNLPDSRISLGFSADENGLQYYNNPNDPMPIKTINMAGLQKWEETDDYIIYVDKDAVMTTVQNYVTGTYDLFLERKNQIDGAIELLRENGIEWTAEDDSKLLQDINLVQLEKIASTPTTMDEPTEIQTFEARTVPTTYECCFRTDKKTGEIYIGEGYENLFDSFIPYDDGNVVSDSNGNFTITSPSRILFRYVSNETGVLGHNLRFAFDKNLEIGDIVNVNTNGGANSTVGSSTATYSSSENKIERLNYGIVQGPGHRTVDMMSAYVNPGTFRVVEAQITKTSTPKPFVKSVMPSGKLSFVTNATSETHSFVFKGVSSRLTEPNSSTYIYVCGAELVYERTTVSNTFEGDCIVSKTFNNVGFIGSKGVTQGFLYLTASKWNKDSFKQLLIYKGNLTESELKAENEKEINVGAYYHQENSMPLTYGIDSMKAIRVYSPALNDIEIVEEVNKNIYIPENRDGVPNYIGEVK